MRHTATPILPSRLFRHLAVMVAAVTFAALVVAELVAPGSASAQGASFCKPGEVPAFTFGFAALKAQLGPNMGAPVECAHPNDANGDVLQNTTSGLSFWRKSTNTPTFTDGYRHWGLTPNGMVAWVGSAIDPPGTAAVAQPPSAAAGPVSQSASAYLPADYELPTGFVEKTEARAKRGPQGPLVDFELREYFRNAAQTGLVVSAGIADSSVNAHILYSNLPTSFIGRGFASQAISVDGTDEAMVLMLIGAANDQFMMLFRVGAIVGQVGWIENHGVITPSEAGRQIGTVAGPMVRKMRQQSTQAPAPAPAAAPAPTPAAAPAPAPATAANCHPSYPDFCIPPPPPDLNCNSPLLQGRRNFTVRPPDPHRFDNDHDGIGCER
jgi:hypothetical protein